MTLIKRKLYKRGSSLETTIPKPLLFELDMDRKHNVLFKFDAETRRWYIDFEPAASAGETEATKEVGKKKRRK
jgi:hypothetical protein